MTYTSRAILLFAALALGACTNAGRFGDDDAVVMGGGAGAGAGDPGNPASPAYFQQAVGDRVLFAVDESRLSGAAKEVLDGQARWLQDNPEYAAIVEGHADEQGTREYNLALGARRANAVREYLVSRGVAGSRVEVVSYGKERPIEICSDESCYAKNRRAVTVISAALSG